MGTSRGGLRAALVVWVVTFGLAPAAGAGSLYFAGSVGISSVTGDSGGRNTFLDFAPTGDDSDSSPIWGGAFGYEFRLDEAVPDKVRPLRWTRRWADSEPGTMDRFRGWGFRLPGWALRVELEGRGGRDFELRTNGFADAIPYRSDVSSWSAMTNTWLDVPVHGPIAALFGRVPLLEPLSVHVGGGLGYARTSVETSDTIVFGDETLNSFVWQAGGGVGYGLTDRVTLSLDYRYVSLGEVDVPLTDTLGDQGHFTLDLSNHELVAGLRFHFYSLSLRRRAR